MPEVDDALNQTSSVLPSLSVKSSVREFSVNGRSRSAQAFLETVALCGVAALVWGIGSPQSAAWIAAGAILLLLLRIGCLAVYRHVAARRGRKSG